MSRTWLILDGNNLMWRAFHAFRGLSHAGGGTGALYGFMKDLAMFQDHYATRNVVFTFDAGKKLKRQEAWPGYKQKRHERKLTDEQLESVIDLRRQMKNLRDTYLPYLGYKNVFWKNGYEADDIIASVVGNLPNRDEAVIISSDKDLFQLISSKVVVLNPTSKKVYNQQLLLQEYGVTPDLWLKVKAIAGCSTDEVPGVKGVKEKTAAKFVNGGKLPDKKRLDIRKWLKSPKYKISLDLVRLPYTGTPDYVPVEDALNVKRWRKLCRKLGMKSLVDKAPTPEVGFGLQKVAIRRSGESN